jgi:hypothetical protein
VLFLRSFADENIANPENTLGSRYETKLVKALTRIGPVIAIGKPGEELPELGAGRLYVAHGDWKRAVEELMVRAKLVVIQIGNSEGILWEVERSLKSLPPSKILLFFPNRYRRPGFIMKSLFESRLDSQERYEHVRPVLEKLIGRPVPPDIGEAPFLYFEHDWTPRVVEPVRPWLISSRGSVEISIGRTLRPFIARILGARQ